MRDYVIMILLAVVLTVQGFILYQIQYLSNVNLLAVAGHNSDIIQSIARGNK